MLYAAAKMYYEEDATQAEIATRMGISRPTVSRLLSEARRQGIVKITVVEPARDADDELRRAVEQTLGLHRVFVSAPATTGAHPTDDQLGAVLGPSVGRALEEAGLVHGDVVCSLPETLEAARARRPPHRLVTDQGTTSRGGSRPTRSPGCSPPPSAAERSISSHRRCQDRVCTRPCGVIRPSNGCSAWGRCRRWCGPVRRRPVPAGVDQYVPTGDSALWQAVGDVCGRFFDRFGEPVGFAGSDRLIALELAELRRARAVVAVAAGAHKVQPIIVAARAGYVNQLVTDPSTAEEILAQA